MAREILLSKKTEQGLRLDPRTKLLLIFIISIFVMGGTGGEAMGLIRLVLCAVPALLLLTSKQFVKAVSYIAEWRWKIYFGPLYLRTGKEVWPFAG